MSSLRWTRSHGRVLSPAFLASIAIFLGACEPAPVSPESDGNAPPLAADLSSSEELPEETLFGVDIFQGFLSSVDTASGDVTVVGTTGFENLGALAVQPSDGTLFAWDDDVRGLMTIDPQTGDATVVGAFQVTSMGSLAFAPDGRLYGQTGFIGGSTVHEIDPATGKLDSKIAEFTSHTGGGADFGPDGKLYLGTSDRFGNSRLYTLDVSTGQKTLVGSIAEDNIQGLAFDREGTLFGTAYQTGSFGATTSKLFRLDPTTGDTSALRTLSGEYFNLSTDRINGMVFWQPVEGSENSAPAADAGGPYSGQEGSPVAFDGTGSTDPDGDVLSYGWTFGDGGSAAGGTPSHSYADDGNYAVSLTVEDPDGATDTDAATATIANVAPTVTEVSGPSDPVAAGSSAAVSASFTDPGTLDTHTAVVDWGDGTNSGASVTESGGSGTLSASHSYASAGVYTVTVTVTDDDGGSGSRDFEYIVVYDPGAGFVTGGGWIHSPAGAYLLEPSLTGRASFGFVSRYQKGAATPSGNTQFRFQAGDLTFHSSEYEWLVIAGARAQYKGRGTLNGTGGYGFMLVGIDGDAPGGGGVDRFRIKIWDLATDRVIYDNRPGEELDSDASTELGGGSVVIHAR